MAPPHKEGGVPIDILEQRAKPPVTGMSYTLLICWPEGSHGLLLPQTSQAIAKAICCSLSTT